MEETNGGPKSGRDERGRWVPGHCPNPSGRGAKKMYLTKSFVEYLADAMEEAPSKRTKVRRETAPPAEAIAWKMIDSLWDMGSRDFNARMKALKDLGVFAELKRRAEAANPSLTREQLEKRIIAKLQELRRLQQGGTGAAGNSQQ